MEENHVTMAEIPLFFLFAYYSDWFTILIYVNRAKAVPTVLSLKMSTPVSVRR